MHVRITYRDILGQGYRTLRPPCTLAPSPHSVWTQPGIQRWHCDPAISSRMEPNVHVISLPLHKSLLNKTKWWKHIFCYIVLICESVENQLFLTIVCLSFVSSGLLKKSIKQYIYTLVFIHGSFYRPWVKNANYKESRYHFTIYRKVTKTFSIKAFICTSFT